MTDSSTENALRYAAVGARTYWDVRHADAALIVGTPAGLSDAHPVEAGGGTVRPGLVERGERRESS